MRHLYRVRMALMFGLALCVGIPLTAGAKSISQTHDRVMEQLETLTPDNSIDVLVATEKDTYELGEQFELRFQVSEPCHIVLMHISTEGDITFLAPSLWIPGEVEGGKPYSISKLGLPIEVQEPGGIETINLFCSQDPLHLFDAELNEEHKFYGIHHDDNEKLNELLTHLASLKSQTWSGSGLTVTIKAEGNTRAIPGALVPPIGTTGSTGKDILFPPLNTTGTTGKTNEP